MLQGGWTFSPGTEIDSGHPSSAMDHWRRTNRAQLLHPIADVHKAQPEWTTVATYLKLPTLRGGRDENHKGTLHCPWIQWGPKFTPLLQQWQRWYSSWKSTPKKGTSLKAQKAGHSSWVLTELGVVRAGPGWTVMFSSGKVTPFPYD